jgi:hypothetical protein
LPTTPTWIGAFFWFARVVSAPAPQVFPLLFVAAIAGTGVGVYGFFRGFGLLQRKRVIADTPTSTIRAASLGHIEVSGTAVGPYTLLSPLSQQECYYYRVIAWKRDRQKESWKKATEEIVRAPLFVDDGTGRLLVDPTGAELDVRATFQETYNSNPFSDAVVPDSVQNFLARRGVDTGSHCKVEEHCIVPQDRLFIQGTLRENAAEEEQGDGHLLGREAAAVQRQVELERMFLPGERVAEREPDAAEDGFEVNPRVVLARGDSRRPFFISEHSQRELLQTLTWKSSLYLWGGPALTLASLWYLLSR